MPGSHGMAAEGQYGPVHGRGRALPVRAGRCRAHRPEDDLPPSAGSDHQPGDASNDGQANDRADDDQDRQEPAGDHRGGARSARTTAAMTARPGRCRRPWCTTRPHLRPLQWTASCRQFGPVMWQICASMLHIRWPAVRHRVLDAVGRHLERVQPRGRTGPGLASVMWLTFPTAAIVGSDGIRS